MCVCVCVRERPADVRHKNYTSLCSSAVDGHPQERWVTGGIAFTDDSWGAWGTMSSTEETGNGWTWDVPTSSPCPVSKRTPGMHIQMTGTHKWMLFVVSP